MQRIYYVIESNDGSIQSDELHTLKKAKRELKSIIAEDKSLGLMEGDIEYRIIKYTEIDGTLYSEEV